MSKREDSLSDVLKQAYSNGRFLKEMIPDIYAEASYRPAWITLVNNQKLTPERIQRQEHTSTHAYSSSTNLCKKRVTVEEFLTFTEDSGKLLLEGISGSGKTRLAIYVCQQWAKGNILQEYDNLIFVPLRLISGSSIKLSMLIELYLSGASATNAVTKLYDSKGRATIFILDGWDQLPPIVKSDFTLLNDLVTGLKLPKASVIVTSGPSTAGAFYCLVKKRFELLGIDQHQIKAVVQDRFLAFSAESQSFSTSDIDVLQHFQKFRNMQADSHIPSILYLFCSVAANRGILPKSITHLVEEFIYQKSQLLYLDEGADKAGLLSRVESDISPLRELALGIFEGKLIFSKDDLKSKGIDLSICCDSLGILTCLKTNFCDETVEPRYKFSSVVVQEYFAAQMLQTMNSDEQALYLCTQQFNKQFQNVFLFLTGISKLEDDSLCDIVLASVECNKQLLLSYLYQTHSPSACARVAKKLHFNFDLSFTYVSQTDFECLAYVITSVGGDWTLDFRKSIIPTQGLKHFSEFLEQSYVLHGEQQETLRIRYLGLAATDLKGASMEGLATLLKGSIPVVELNLWSNYRLKDSGIQILSDTLSNNCCHLEKIHISRCGLTDSGASALADMLTKNKHMKMLRLFLEEEISSEGLKSLSDILCVNTTLREMGLRCVNMTRIPLLHLAHCLTRNATLEILRVDRNKLDSSDCDIIVDLIDKRAGNIKLIDLSKNPIGDEGFIKIINALQRMDDSSVVELNVMGCGIGNQGIKVFSEYLKVTKRFKGIQLGLNNAVDDEGGCSLLEAIKQNVSLTRILLEGLTFSPKIKNEFTQIARKGLLVTFMENARYKLFQGKEEI